MRCAETTLARILQIRDDSLVIHGSARTTRAEVTNRVQVRNVHHALVGRRAVGATLLNIHGKERNVNAVDTLEEEDSLGAVGHLRRVFLAFISASEVSAHKWMHLMRAVVATDHAQSHRFGGILFAQRHKPPAHALLQKVAHSCAWQRFCRHVRRQVLNWARRFQLALDQLLRHGRLGLQAYGWNASTGVGSRPRRSGGG